MKLAKSMFLPLAERMTKKYVEEGRVNAEAGRFTDILARVTMLITTTFYVVCN